MSAAADWPRFPEIRPAAEMQREATARFVARRVAIIASLRQLSPDSHDEWRALNPEA